MAKYDTKVVLYSKEDRDQISPNALKDKWEQQSESNEDGPENVLFIAMEDFDKEQKKNTRRSVYFAHDILN